MSDLIEGQVVCFTETNEVSGAVTRYAKYEHDLRAFNNARNIRHLTVEEVGPRYIPRARLDEAERNWTIEHCRARSLMRQLDEALHVLTEIRTSCDGKASYYARIGLDTIREMKNEV